MSIYSVICYWDARERIKFAYIWITYYLVSIAESYLVANIAIPENYEKLIVSLRTTQSKEYSLDKEQTSYDHLLDALRLALKGFEFK